MSTDVIIPWAPDPEGHRQRALDYVTALYEQHCPSWGILLGEPPPGPWVKALAVEYALRRSTAEVIVIADADVWAPSIAKLPGALSKAPWAMPHRWVRRYTQESTDEVLSGERAVNRGLNERPEYQAFPGGGVVAMRREVYDDCPLDPRFVGWGHEDESWARALACLHGKRWAGHDHLVHLWHPPQDRNGAHGSDESWALREQYRRLQQAHDRTAMRELVDGARALLDAA